MSPYDYNVVQHKLPFPLRGDVNESSTSQITQAHPAPTQYKNGSVADNKEQAILGRIHGLQQPSRVPPMLLLAIAKLTITKKAALNSHIDRTAPLNNARATYKYHR